jgi:plasmid stabilization system protein ParE
VSYTVRFTRDAADDLQRLFDFILERDTAQGGDFDQAARALSAIERAIDTLRFTPFTCRKAGRDPFIRELVIPFGGAGYVALFEIEASDSVVIAAVRHQREDDYH